MPRSIVGGIKNLLNIRSNDAEVISLGWFGGEPLLAIDIVLEISRFLSRLVLNSQHKVDYDGHMTTNGCFLDTDTLKGLTEAGISRYQITLDGWAAQHDSTRKTDTGDGSFSRIWSNLLAASESNLNFSILIRIHLSKENYSNICQLIKRVNSTFRGDSRFKVFIHVIENLGSCNNRFNNYLEYEKNISMRNDMELLIDEGLRINPNRDDNYVCYASQPGSFCIRADGRLSKCTVALYDEVNIIGRINEDGRLLIDPDKHSYWLRGIELGDMNILKCPRSGKPSGVKNNKF
jgi:uncharacterized protein